VSLITDALGLRQKKPVGASPARNLPPLPVSRRFPVWPGLVAALCLLVVALFWKGGEALTWLEELAGISSGEIRPAPARPAAAPAAGVIPPEAPPKPATPAASTETTPKAVVAVPAVASSDVPSAPAPAAPAKAAAPGTLLDPATASPKPSAAKVSGTLQPVVVESVEKARSMDPKFIEQERRNRVENFLSGLRVQGVRIQGPESRIMVDGALISLGEPIGDFGLRLKSVESGRLVFVDEEGREYPKSY